MNPKSNPPAEAAAKVAAERRERKQLLGRLFYVVCLAIGVFLGWAIWSTPLEQPAKLPRPGVFVIAYTRTGWYKAFLTDTGEFRNAEDGLPLGTVIYWSYPPHTPWN